MYNVFGEITAFLNLVEKYKKRSKNSGITGFYDRRSALGEEWWDKFFLERKNPKHFAIMGQSLAKAFQGDSRLSVFRTWCESGTNMRILLLSPEASEVSQIVSVGKGISYQSVDDPNIVLRKKIKDTVVAIHNSITMKITNIQKKPMLRYATRDMPFSIVAIDEDMVITFYSLNPEADEEATIVIKGEETPAYVRFIKEFEEMWRDHSRVTSYDDPILKDYRHDWLEYIPISDYDQIPGPPRQAIIYPTYQCAQTCSYCMYQELRQGNIVAQSTREMSLKNFEDTIVSLINFGVRRIEISGGGEPLDHCNISGILEILAKRIEETPDLKIGLLTNGININKIDNNKLLKAFNDYIRISRFEAITLCGEGHSNNLLATWRQTIKNIMKEKRMITNNKTKIGIKYLLTKSNLEFFVDSVKSDINDRELLEVQHFRFRSSRDVPSDRVAQIEKEIYHVLEKVGLPSDDPMRVSLSLGHVLYPRNFRCWISPMNVVVVPGGDLYMCCNFAYDVNAKCIGNILKEDFKTIWESERHRSNREKIRRSQCDREGYCNCRYAELQSQLERITPFLHSY